MSRRCVGLIVLGLSLYGAQAAPLNPAGRHQPLERGTARPAAATPASLLGLNMHPERPAKVSADKQFELCRGLGIHQVRVSLEWAGIEPERGRYDFAAMDRMVKLAERNDCRLLQVLGYNVPWNTSIPGNTKTRPVDLGAFETFVRRMAERYQGKIRWWEIWNEPNIDTFLTGAYALHPDRRWQDYRRIVERARRALKRVDPTNVVVLGGLAHTSEAWGDALESCYRAGVISLCDVVAIHPYVGDNPDDPLAFSRAVQQMLDVMKRHGDAGRPVWITEAGLPTAGHPLAVDENRQADFLERILTAALGTAQIEKVFIYALLDDEESFGLFRTDGSAKRSALRIQSLLSSQGQGTSPADRH